MKLNRILAVLACAGMAAAGTAPVALSPAFAKQESGAIPPARVGELRDFSADEQEAYLTGVLQALAYLMAKTSEDYEQAACLAGQAALGRKALRDAESSDPAAIEIEFAVTDACEAGEGSGTSTLLRADDAEEWFGGGRPDTERALFVLGLSDTLYFRVFTRVEDDVAECVQELSQVAMAPDNEFSQPFLAEPSDPLVRDLIDRPVSACLE